MTPKLLSVCVPTHRRPPADKGLPQAVLRRRCRRPRRRSSRQQQDIGRSLLDEYGPAFTIEIDCLDLLLATVANLIRDTTQSDEAIRITDLLETVAASIWRRHDHELDSDLDGIAVGFLAAEAAWAIAYAAGVPGCDRSEASITATLDWLQAAPRPLRSQLIRGAARFLF